MQQSGPPSLSFPCEFFLKVIGWSSDEFESAALTIVHKHVPNLMEGSIKITKSRGGKYASITITFQAQAQAQLDALYTELSGHPAIIMAL